MFIDIFPSYKALGRPRCAGQFQEGFSTLLRPLSVPRWENSEMDGLVGTIRRKKNIFWLVVHLPGPTPLKNDGVRQLG